MKVQDVLKEVWDDDEDQRQLENPVPHAPQAAFEYMDAIDGALSDAYKQEHGIEEFSGGHEYVKMIHEQRRKFGELADIPLNKILATETRLYNDHIDKIIKGGGVKSSSVLPILYKKGDVYFVGDGNHRVAAAQINGEKSVKVIVLDGDRILKNKE